MITFLIKRFIKNFQDTSDPSVRKAYGILSGVVGIICNVFLFFIKFIIGLWMNSIAIISDAFNNLTDSGSSIITIFGANLSSKPADKEHPYGHGRMEYIASLGVSFIIFSVGLELLTTSIKKITNPEDVFVDPIAIIILVFSILIKIWMYGYNRSIGKKIKSGMNLATAKDSINDAISSFAVIIGTILGAYVDFPIDGILGVLISLFIMYTGFSIAKDSVNFLLGPSPDPEILERIEQMIEDNGLVRSCHDLRVHDYGPGSKVASLHVVVPPDIRVEEAHQAIFELEGRINAELGIDIVIHMDPEEDIDEKLAGK